MVIKSSLICEGVEIGDNVMIPGNCVIGIGVKVKPGTTLFKGQQVSSLVWDSTESCYIQTEEPSDEFENATTFNSTNAAPHEKFGVPDKDIDQDSDFYVDSDDELVVIGQTSQFASDIANLIRK